MYEILMDIKVKPEHIDTVADIKQENELIIESEWVPTKLENEENDYYQEFENDCNQNMFQETVGQFSIEYLDESRDYDGDYEDDSYEFDNNIENDSDEASNHLGQLETQDVGDDSSPESNALANWVVGNYIVRECSVCNERFRNYDSLRRHLLKHKESIEESETNYSFTNDNCGICKKCNQKFVGKLSRYMHSIKHSEDSEKVNILHSICKLCNFSSKCITVRKHILGKHPEVLKDYKASCAIKDLKCPLCSNTYVRRTHLFYHFADKHSHQFKSKLSYHCHLCEPGIFIEEHIFMQHLIEMHELKSWQILNYQKVFQDKEYLACTKCGRLFFQNDTFKLLKHYLKHDCKFSWSCKYCYSKTPFKSSPDSHMCVKMLRYYEKHREEIIDGKVQENRLEVKVKYLQQFEERIAHVCPFCNEEFGKMLKWQHHLKTDHEIDSLKSLGMSIIGNDSSKLCCTICHTVVANSPQQLHAHRFQHLPYEPYKCLFCKKTLTTFKIAVEHASTQCKDEPILIQKGDSQLYDIRSNIEMQCSCCNYLKIRDVKSVFKHYKDEHNYFEDFFIKHSDNSMTCKICHKKHDKSICFQHLHIHFDEKSFKCKLCLRSYTTYKRLYNHFLEVHNVKPLNKQSNDIKTGKKSFFLTKDGEITNVRKKSSVKMNGLNEFTEFITYTCPECNEDMTSQQDWQNHIETQHSFFEESNLYITDTDGYRKCPTCKLNISSILLQQRHKLSHMPYKSFMCNLCYVRFSYLGALYQHFRQKHFAQGTFNCYICSEILRTEHSRTLHIKETHPRSEWPENMCLICYKLLTSKSKLNNHMVIHDEDRFKYSCDVCGAKVFLSKSYDAHMSMHKQRGQIKEESQAASKNHKSATTNEGKNLSESEVEYISKRKLIFTSPGTKKIKVGAE